MSKNPVKLVGSKFEFAGFGKSTLAYVRRVERDDLVDYLSGVDDLEDGTELWGLFAADGEPLAVSDDEAVMISNAYDRELLPVSRH